MLGTNLLHRIKDAVKSTDRPGVIGEFGSFGDVRLRKITGGTASSPCFWH